MHHVNIVSFFYVIHYVAYFNQRTVKIGTHLGGVLCQISEFIWGIQKFLRTYSILLLAIYRYLAVYQINYYRKLNNKPIYMFISIGFIWFISILITLILKLSFKSSYSVYFCSPGYSDVILNIILYFIIVNILCNILPISVVVIFYILISNQLKLNRKNLNDHFISSLKMSKIDPVVESNCKCNSPPVSDHMNRVKLIELKFAKQMILINIFNIISSAFSILVNFQMVLAAHESFNYLDEFFLELRPLFRGIFLVCQTFIPVLSILYNPDVNYFYKFSNLKQFLTKTQRLFSF